MQDQPASSLPFVILPWNGHQAAVSLTFDDTEPHHLECAVPELDRRGLRATFYAMPQHALPLKDQWQAAFARGHEAGNHSLTHPQPAGFGTADCIREVDGAQTAFFDLVGVRPPTFAYPYTVVTPEYRAILASRFVAARGGGDRLIPPQPEPDWLNLPCVATLTDRSLADYQDWVARTREAGGLLVFMIHGVGDSPWGWQPITLETYRGLLDHLLAQAELWVAPLGQTAAYFRAGFILAQAMDRPAGPVPATPSSPASAAVWRSLSWEVPAFFEPGLSLRLGPAPGQPSLAGLVRQAGQVLPVQADGSVLLRFGAGGLDYRAG